MLQLFSMFLVIILIDAIGLLNIKTNIKSFSDQKL